MIIRTRRLVLPPLEPLRRPYRSAFRAAFRAAFLAALIAALLLIYLLFYMLYVCLYCSLSCCFGARARASAINLAMRAITIALSASPFCLFPPCFAVLALLAAKLLLYLLFFFSARAQAPSLLRIRTTTGRSFRP